MDCLGVYGVILVSRLTTKSLSALKRLLTHQRNFPGSPKFCPKCPEDSLGPAASIAHFRASSSFSFFEIPSDGIFFPPILPINLDFGSQLLFGPPVRIEILVHLVPNRTSATSFPVKRFRRSFPMERKGILFFSPGKSEKSGKFDLKMLNGLLFPLELNDNLPFPWLRRQNFLASVPNPFISVPFFISPTRDKSIYFCNSQPPPDRPLFYLYDFHFSFVYISPAMLQLHWGERKGNVFPFTFLWSTGVYEALQLLLPQFSPLFKGLFSLFWGLSIPSNQEPLLPFLSSNLAHYPPFLLPEYNKMNSFNRVYFLLLGTLLYMVLSEEEYIAESRDPTPEPTNEIIERG